MARRLTTWRPAVVMFVACAWMSSPALTGSESATLARPDIPDPFGLGDRLALIDYLKTRLHAPVAEGATYDDLVRQYWSIVDQPRQAAAADQEARVAELRDRLQHEFGISSTEADPARLEAQLADAADKATLHGVDPVPDPGPTAHVSAADELEKTLHADVGPGTVVPSATTPAAPPAVGTIGWDPDAKNEKDDPWGPGLKTMQSTTTTYHFTVPDGWRMTRPVMDSAGKDMLFVIAPLKGSCEIGFRISDTRVKAGFEHDQEVDDLCAKLAPTTVEKKADARPLDFPSGVDIFGSYAEFTCPTFLADNHDPNFIVANPPPGTYRVVCIGLFAFHFNQAIFTVIGTGADDPDYQTALAIPTSFTLRP